ncbi:hypothetical protein ASE52_15620 [Acidovorax sp. Root275]|uniref:hypothetical protein n=1 Tax=Acidovorax sp. Root275 TaxID=1736508 RepID=UPI00070BB469|nr:hypothetical protein [Acidovorax sp. Root275]KRD46128.1 hypothetical protein ASE52_15620 [Acidovorax sp. Root275]
MNHTPRLLRSACATAAALAALTASFTLHAATTAESGYVGEYRGGSVDTIAQLALLADNTFCFALTGGALDMVMAGRWKSEGSGVRLQQVRQDQTLFPAYARKVAALGAMVEFDFHGHTLSSARAPVFAVSADDKAPAALRPLFGQGNSNWSENYPLPPLPAESVRYFYLGDVVEEAPGKPAVVKVVQYRLDGANSVRVGFDPLQAMPLMNQRAELQGDMLFLSGSRLGKRRALDPEVVQTVRTGCIAPALNPGAPRPALKQGETQPLQPLRTFTVSPSTIQGTPFFEAKSN